MCVCVTVILLYSIYIYIEFFCTYDRMTWMFIQSIQYWICIPQFDEKYLLNLSLLAQCDSFRAMFQPCSHLLLKADQVETASGNIKRTSSCLDQELHV